MCGFYSNLYNVLIGVVESHIEYKNMQKVSRTMSHLMYCIINKLYLFSD